MGFSATRGLRKHMGPDIGNGTDDDRLHAPHWTTRTPCVKGGTHPYFFLRRPDGTTAAERFLGQKPRSLFAAILDAADLPPGLGVHNTSSKVADNVSEAELCVPDHTDAALIG
jgi:hypothetical protein